MTCPVVVVGGGLAGLATALALAPMPVTLVTAAPIGEQASSGWAQGGIAAAVAANDSPALHGADTLAAGDGLCDAATVARITAAGPALIAGLRAAGVQFDPDLGLEAAHGRRRIVHSADGTGREVMRALAARVAASRSITVVAGEVVRLVLRAGAIGGVVLADGQVLKAARVVLATGGIGGLYAHTTNPRGAWGQGLLLAAQAGAVLTDLEFVQFHPTALDVGRNPMPLVSEAVRGEGAILIDEQGERFMAGQGRAELEPRDVVSRAVWAHQQAGHRVYLDATGLGAGFVAQFPGIAGACAAAGIDPVRQPIPIRPAAHYHMGGIEADAEGRTGVPGLYACGECAGTGLHGANRLASNSLLEAGVCGALVADSIKASPGTPPSNRGSGGAAPSRVQGQSLWPCPITSSHLGVLRDRKGLERAVCELLRLADGRNPATVSLAIAVCALQREESRGAHARIDFPAPARQAARSRITLDQVFEFARAVALADA